jgi:hypothetical protein
MGKIVVSENVSLDGVVQDPTGEEGFKHGGWFNQISDKDREGRAKVGLDEELGAEALQRALSDPGRAHCLAELFQLPSPSFWRTRLCDSLTRKGARGGMRAVRLLCRVAKRPSREGLRAEHLKAIVSSIRPWVCLGRRYFAALCL